MPQQFIIREEITQSGKAKKVTLIRVLKETKFSFKWQICLPQSAKESGEGSLNHSLITVDILKKYYSKAEQKVLKRVSVGEVILLDKIKEVTAQSWHAGIEDFENWAKKIPF